VKDKSRTFFRSHIYVGGPGSSGGIATGYGLDGLGSNPGCGRDLPPVQTGPGAHPASCTMVTGSLPGVKSDRGVKLTPHPFKYRGEERVELDLYSPYGPYGLYRASVPAQWCTLPLYLYCLFALKKVIYFKGNMCRMFKEE